MSNGAHVSTLNLGVVWCGSCNVRRILVCDTKVGHTRYWRVAQTLCTLDMGAWCMCYILGLSHVELVHAKYGCII